MTDSEYEILQWLLDGAKQSVEADWEVSPDDELFDAWTDFHREVWEQMRSTWSPLTEEKVEELEDEGDDDFVRMVYHTLAGDGIDVADGRYDHILGSSGAKGLADWIRKNSTLNEYVDDTGGGEFSQALDEAVWRQEPKRPQRSMRRRKQPKRNPKPKKNPRSVIAKYLRGIK